MVEAGISKNEAKLIVATAAAPPNPPKKPNGEHERTLAEAKGAVLRLMEENKRLREESSAGLVKENRRLRDELAAAKASRSEEIAAAAAKAYTSEKAANRCALEGLELMKRERENAVRALAEETAAHAETKRELHDRDEKARTRAMFFATELEDAVRNLAEERQAHQATRQQLTPFLSGAYQGGVEAQLTEWRASAQDALKELAMERDVHVRTKKALDAEQAAHAATRDRTVMRVVESKRALEAEQVAHAATRAELSATKGALARMAARAGAFGTPEKSKTAPTAEPPTAEPTSEPELTTEPI